MRIEREGTTVSAWIIIGGTAGGLADIVLLFALVRMARRYSRLELWWLILGIFFTPLVAGIAMLMCGDLTPKEDNTKALRENQSVLRQEFSDLKAFLSIRLQIEAGDEDTREIDDMIQDDSGLLVDDSEET